MICQPPALADYTDTFDRADSSDLGADWRPEFGSMVIATNRAQSRSVPSNTARTGQWETYVGDYGGRLFTDNWEITAPLQPPVGTGSVANFSGVGMGMQDSGPAAGMVLVYAIGNRTTGTGSGGTRIMTYTGSGIAAPGTTTGLTGQTVRSNNGSAMSMNTSITLRRRMYSATQSVFTVLVDGSSAGTWDDSTGVVPAGDDYRRRWFIVTEVNYPNFLQNQYSSGLAEVRARDITT
ncbi:hypothetical protein [Nocardia farcinica]|uniref:hypothetical protein n=1 Tax=Nocardia farcinica TaxID=37329 RepID=UPI002455C0B3|nr:hypothetical protein [Nocardia farcinica]